ncbi:hypothetical protein PIB30_085103 [Stylosanthes scabra]|uniref:Uncharacterized protein n=1 Tax=Stylosanthes scabra TaxID=79078 RepID=A0ABU6VUS1_9FABA|nr:hypothetical protein [Stylosanthes scabra]
MMLHKKNAIDNDYESSSSSTRLVDKEEQDFMLRANRDFSVSNLEVSGTILPQSNKAEAVSKMEEEPLVGNSMKVELQSQIEDVEKILEMIPIMTPLLKRGSSYDQEVLPLISKKKPPVSSFKLLKSNRISKVASTPIKPITAFVSSKRDNSYIVATPTSSSNKHENDHILWSIVVGLI